MNTAAAAADRQNKTAVIIGNIYMTSGCMLALQFLNNTAFFD